MIARSFTLEANTPYPPDGRLFPCLGWCRRKAFANQPLRMSAIVETLASDPFGGRAPGSAGEAKTVDYLVHQFKVLGLKPAGTHCGWTQAVPLVHNTPGLPTHLGVRVGGDVIPWVVGRDINPQTVRPVSNVTITDAPLVFVGYGVAAPERNWA
jgi:aminopeptidase